MIILQRITKKAGGRLILDIPKLEFQEGRRLKKLADGSSSTSPNWNSRKAAAMRSSVRTAAAKPPCCA